VKEKIRETIDYFRSQSGYILSTSHVIEGDIPPENIDALFNETFYYQIKR
jgi:uroporphyrinogen-III decarboxylase